MERFWRWLSRRNPAVLAVGAGVLLLWALAGLILFFRAESRQRVRVPREPQDESYETSEIGIVRLGDARPRPEDNLFMSPVVQRWLDARSEEARVETERAAAVDPEAAGQPDPSPSRIITLLYRGMMVRVDGTLLALVQQDEEAPFYVRSGDPFAGGTVQRIARQGMEWVVDDEALLLPLGEAVRVEERAP